VLAGLKLPVETVLEPLACPVSNAPVQPASQVPAETVAQVPEGTEGEADASHEHSVRLCVSEGETP
jgi:hypothetical protein